MGGEGLLDVYSGVSSPEESTKHNSGYKNQAHAT